MPKFTAKLVRPFPSPGAYLVKYNAEYRWWDIQVKSFRFKIVSPVQDPWDQYWAIQLRTQVAKDRQTRNKKPNGFRLALSAPVEPPSAELEWVSDKGLVCFARGDRATSFHVSPHIRYSWDAETGGTANTHWLILLVLSLQTKSQVFQAPGLNKSQ